jgi:hypothetical protein
MCITFDGMGCGKSNHLSNYFFICVDNKWSWTSYMIVYQHQLKYCKKGRVNVIVWYVSFDVGGNKHVHQVQIEYHICHYGST